MKQLYELFKQPRPSARRLAIIISIFLMPATESDFKTYNYVFMVLECWGWIEVIHS